MSMTDVHQSLYQFWNSFGVPCYLSGHVPQGSPLPYITFDAAGGDALQRDVLTAFNWHKAQSGVNVNAERAALMDRIAKAIPAEGCLIPCGDGRLFMYRNTSTFQTYYDDPEDESIIGGRTSYIISYMTI